MRGFTKGAEAEPVSPAAGHQLSERHRYVALKIKDVIVETPNARSLVLDLPPGLREDFSYSPGQFLTVRLRLGFDRYIRCYSLSSCPVMDSDLKITVKRVAGGFVSNWINDMLRPGYQIETMPPAGDFVLAENRNMPIIALCSGSGITPVMSIVKTALAGTDRSVRLLYANQSTTEVIFAAELEALAHQYPDRLTVEHHIYEEQGYVEPGGIASFVGGEIEADVYVSGSRHFTAAARDAVRLAGLRDGEVHYESFLPSQEIQDHIDAGQPGVGLLDESAIVESSETEVVVIHIKGELHEVPYVRGETLLATARRATLAPPYSCSAGGCAACAAVVGQGDVAMTFNHALAQSEVEDGWVLTCKSYPLSPRVVVGYPA